MALRSLEFHDLPKKCMDTFCNIQRKVVTATILQHTWKTKTKSVHITVFNTALKVPYQNWLSPNNLLIGGLLFLWCKHNSSRVRNKHSPMLINFLTFFQGLRPYSGLHRAYFSSIRIMYKLGYAYSFCQIFQGLRLFKGLRLFQNLE